VTIKSDSCDGEKSISNGCLAACNALGTRECEKPWCLKSVDSADQVCGKHNMGPQWKDMCPKWKYVTVCRPMCCYWQAI
jgi:hypothetical protein